MLLQQLLNGLKHDGELPVELPFQLPDFLLKIAMRGQPFPQLRESPHDVNIDVNGALTSEN